MARFNIVQGIGTIATGTPTFTGTYLKPGVLSFREISSPVPIPFKIGDYVDYTRTGLRYSLYKIPQVKKQARYGSHGAAYVYQNVEFHDASYELEICPFRDLVTGDNLVHFSTQSAISVFDDVAGIAERIQACLDAFRPNGWTVRLATAEMGASTELLALMQEEREFVVSGVTLLGVLDKIYEVWPEVGWIYTFEGGVNVITIGGAGLNGAGDAFKYGKGHGLTALTKTDADSSQIANRLYVYGSNRNMLANWYNHQEIHGAESVDIQNLMLPIGPVSGGAVKYVYNGKIYTYSGRVYTYADPVAHYSGWGLTDGLPDPAKAFVHDEASILARGLREKTVYFDGSGDLKEIYPTIEGVTIAEVRDASPEYVPAAGWDDATRVDEVHACTNPADNGFASSSNGKSADVVDYCPYDKNGQAVTIVAGTTLTYPVCTKQFDVGAGTADITIEHPSFGMIGGVTDAKVVFTLYRVRGGESERFYEARVQLNPGDAGSYSVREGSVKYEDAGVQFISGDKVEMKCALELSNHGTGVDTNELLTNVSGTLTYKSQAHRQKTFKMTLRQIGFNIAEQAALGEGMTLAMRTGKCAGREFKIKGVTYVQSSDTWELEVIRSEDESLAQWFPNSVYTIESGDHFVLLDIAMPGMYISIAEKRLLAAAQELLADTAKEQWQYTPEIDAEFMVNSGRTILPGRNITLDSDITPLGNPVSILVDSVTINEGDAEIPTYKVTLRDRKRKTYSDKASVTQISSRPVEDLQEVTPVDSSSSGGGSGTDHTHANKDVLDKLGLNGLYLTEEGNKIQAGYADSAGEATHAVNADNATEAGHAGTADLADEATHAADADHADNADEAIHSQSADYADDSDKWDGAEFSDYLNQGVRKTDNVEFAQVDAGKVVSNDIESSDFSTGALGTGFRLNKPVGGNSHLEIDEITVRKTMRVFELIIQQIQHQGGIVIFSAASLECTAVEELQNGYKCYFDTKEDENGNAQVPNLFVVGDQARCQRFQLATTIAKYYWRLVTEVGEDYIVLSKTDCDTGSGVPAVGDNIVQLGHRTNTARQNAEVITTTDGNSPRTDYYKGINSYDLTGTLITTVGVKNGEVGVWTKNGSFEGVVTITGGAGLQNLDEWTAVSQSISDAADAAQTAQLAADKANAAIAQINDDTILDPLEKISIRTEWITINGIEDTGRNGSTGSYYTTKQLIAQYGNLGGQVKYVYNGKVYTYNGLVYTYKEIGEAVLDAAYIALREYLNAVGLNDRQASFEGFDRAYYSKLLTDYYDAEIRVNDGITKALQNQIAVTKAELLADLAAYEAVIDGQVRELKDIVDNTIETWFADGTPTASNYPALDWNTEELKARHLGDLYYDNGEGVTAGFAFRWERSGVEGSYTYFWNQLQDSAVAKALAAAARAQDTADGKRRTFLAQPTTQDAYDAGDMWLHATLTNTSGSYTNETLVAIRHKDSGDTFLPDDWVRADKYTDDTVANTARQEAAAAQQTADSAKSTAEAARDRLNNWANDGYISPTEKTALKQQQKDIQQEKDSIVADANRYSLSASAITTYQNAYNNANTALSYYTTATPENIQIVNSGTYNYGYIAAYYDARTTILGLIAAAAKGVADAAQTTADNAATAAANAASAAAAARSVADAAKASADAANLAISLINDDAVLDLSEKAAMRTHWISVNGIVSTDREGPSGTYAAAKQAIVEIGSVTNPTRYTYGGKVYTYNGVVYTYNNVGGAALDAAYLALREFLSSVGLNQEVPFEGFDRTVYSDRGRDYDVALTNVQKNLSEIAKKTADDALEKVGEVEYLKSALAKDDTIITGGMVLSSFIGVKDGNDVKAAINASNQVAGFVYASAFSSVGDHGRLMIASGITALATAYMTAATRIFEDGTIFTNKLHAADGGTIGGFTIGNTDLHNGMTGISDTDHDGIYLGTDGIALGKGAFKVSAGGALTSTSGTIGGFTIGSGSLYNGMTSLSDTTHNGVYVGTDGIALGKGAFKVTSAGALTSTSGTIGGFTIGASSIGTTSVTYGNAYTGIQNGRIYLQNSNSASGMRYVELNAAGGSSKIRVYSDYDIDTGLYIGGKIETAIWAETGVFAGLRPQVNYLTNSDFPYTLRWDDFNVFIHNTNDVTLTLPYYPLKGQTVHIVKTGGGKLNLNCNGKTLWLNGSSKSGTFNITSQNSFIVIFAYTASNWVASLHIED